jgi:hypothetical protein
MSRKVAGALLGLLALLALIGPGILVWQFLQWRKDGHWYPVPVLAAFDYFHIPYPQTHSKFLISFLDLPLSFTAFIMCLYFMAIILAVLDANQKTIH